MAQTIEMKEFNNEIKQSLISAESRISEITDYENDPHIYSSFFEYLLAMIGLQVGFGSFWRFPYITYKNGGGTFLVVYAIVMVVVGIPMLYLETAIGQMHRKSYPFILKKIHPALKLLGVAFVLNSLHIVTYYNLILTYSYRYLLSAFSWELPYANEKITENHFLQDVVLHKSGSINQYGGFNVFLFVIFCFSLYICHLVVKNGAKTSGKVVIVTALSPFLFFLILLGRAFFLEGASQGLVYLFQPKWQLLLGSQIWIDGLSQAFFQFSISLGCLVNMAAMKPKRQDFLKSTYLMAISIVVCNLLSSLNVFMYMGHFCEKIGISIQSLELAGIQLSYNLFPKALCLLPWPNLWIFIFFLSMIFLGLDSLFALIQSIYFYIKDEFYNNEIVVFNIKIDKKRGQYIVLGFILLTGPFYCSYAGIYYLQFADTFIVSIPLTFGSLIQVYIFVYLFKFQQTQKEVKKWTKVDTPYFIRYFLESKILVILLAINFLMAFAHQLFIYQKYSFDFYVFGWFITLYPIIIYLVYFRKNWTNKSDMKLTFAELNYTEN